MGSSVTHVLQRTHNEQLCADRQLKVCPNPPCVPHPTVSDMHLREIIDCRQRNSEMAAKN